MRQSLAQKIQIPDRTWQRNTDSPNMWIAVFAGSIALHLLAFWLGKSLNIYGSGGGFVKSSQSTAIPIEILDPPATTGKSQTAPAPKSVKVPSTITTQEKPIAPTTVPNGEIALTKPQPQKKSQEKPIFHPNPALTPKPTQTHIQTSVNQQQLTPQRQNKQQFPHKSSQHKVENNQNSNSNSFKHKNIRIAQTPTSTPSSETSPNKSSSSTTGSQQPSPSPTNGQRIIQVPVNNAGRNPRAGKNTRQNTNTQIGLGKSTPLNSMGGLIATWNPISKSQEMGLRKQVGLHTDEPPTRLAQPKYKIEPDLPPMDIQPANLVVSLVIDNKTGDCQGTEIIGEETTPGNLTSFKPLAEVQQKKYKLILDGYCQSEKFIPAQYQNITQVPPVSELYMELKIKNQ